MTFGQWRFLGPIDGKGTGAAILAGLWLSGDPETLQSLREKDQLITGQPVLITDPTRAGQLRKQLQNLLLHLGEFISAAHYSDEEIKKANRRINELVQGFTLANPEVHIGLEVDPDSVTPSDSRKVLEIKYQINERFLGEEKAKARRAECVEKIYPTSLDPTGYIGNPNKKAYFDMFLDIQVSVNQ
jgi:1-acyl-sn-glycerol-3-phosphate acyltransferase